MLLIHHDQSQMFKRCKQCRAWSDHNINLPRLGTFKLIKLLSLGKSGVHDRYALPKPPVKTAHGLKRQRDLGDQHDHLLMLCNHLLNDSHIDFCFAASCHTVDQVCFTDALQVISGHGIYNPSLLVI